MSWKKKEEERSTTSSRQHHQAQEEGYHDEDKDVLPFRLKTASIEASEGGRNEVDIQLSTRLE